ncbi:VIT family protein [Nakamurella antarctica]|uniref:VIT family protein n=1 Tax=Nakamurella antarctica TaxID=1902245 RepID=A0A3G8ZTN4_9ACTN|nr:VIT family protein [Nakamurella antarctica]AZI57161.1 VIT family protein [Nakamurella antarctica]
MSTNLSATGVEPHDNFSSSRLNWLRASVLGANDGIVSTAALVLGFAGATSDRSALLLAGIVGLLAGAMSMGVGEYVSVATQRASEQAMLALERRELAEWPEQELEELTQIYQAKGLSAELASRVAVELTAKDAFRAHAEAELGLDPDELTNPWHAAFASFLSFVTGAMIPLLAVLLGANAAMIAVSVGVAMALTGWFSSVLGRTALAPALLRNVGGGALAMVITYGLGSLAGSLIM